MVRARYMSRLDNSNVPNHATTTPISQRHRTGVKTYTRVEYELSQVIPNQ